MATEQFSRDSIDGRAWAQRFIESVADPTVDAVTPWFSGAIFAGYKYGLKQQRESSNIDIQQNELITYMQCGATRLQQLVDLFGQMVQDKSGDPATRMQKIDALADITKNQIQELQTIATPTR